ncbi:hypothetical protein FQN57_003573 [Myotisia sp. PD_48]|nr:hypothetical protein FQN57_003573 [Myotisia sp. PD_48]
MRFFQIAMLALASLFFDIALGAGCYSDRAVGNCLSKARLNTVVKTYCGNNWKSNAQTWRRWFGENDRSQGSIGHVGAFRNSQDCIEAGNSIVAKCHGRSKGGAAEIGGGSLNIVFCPFRV